MDAKGTLTPAKSANRLNTLLKVFHTAHGGDRFPVDVDKLAYDAHEIFGWSDPITKIQEVELDGFEGMLASDDRQTRWMIAYNPALTSQGRVRFTKAHELGHYILHRHAQAEFRCTREDMLNWGAGGGIESEADRFASYLLMPLDDFREQATGPINLDMFSHCADRYGVSLTAAILKWLSYTDQKAVLVVSNDGFINWASSSDPAHSAGAYFKTRNNVIEIPEASLTADASIRTNVNGAKISAKTWFEYADTDADLTEMKLYSDRYDSTLTLLLLPQYADFTRPRF